MSGDVRVIDDVASFVQFIDSFMCKSMSRRHRSLDSFIWRSAAAFADAAQLSLLFRNLDDANRLAVA